MVVRKSLLAGVCLLSFLLSSCKEDNKPVDAFLDYANKAVEGDFDAFAKGFYTDNLNSSLHKDSLMSEVMVAYRNALNDKFKGLKAVEVVSDSVFDNGRCAVLRVKWSFGNGSSEETEFEMIQSKDKWLINMSL